MNQLKIIILTIILFVPIALSAQNKNANPTDVAYAARLEMPRLKGDARNLFVVHEVADYGVNYALEWNCTKKAQRWSAYQWYKDNSVQNWSRSGWADTEWNGDPFQEDPSIPEQYRSTLRMHQSNGYDRGHIVASNDRVNSKDANEQTFYLSNMQPQIHSFNAGIWERMEAKLRSWNNNSFRDTLYVVKGGTIDRDPQILEITDKQLLVPRYFFMGVLCVKNGSYKAMGFWIEHKENGDSDIAKYAVTIDQIESMTGLDLFCNLPDDIEAQVEANLNKQSWNLSATTGDNPDLDNTKYEDDNGGNNDDDKDEGEHLYVTNIQDGQPYILASQLEEGGDWYVADVIEQKYTYGDIPPIILHDEEEIPSVAQTAYYIFNKVENGVYTMRDSYQRFLYMKDNYNTINVSPTLPSDDGALWRISFDDDGRIRIINRYSSKTFQYNPSYYKGYVCYKNINEPLPFLYEPVGADNIYSVCNHPTSVTGIYNLSGILVGNDLNELPKGIYIVNKNGKLIKIIK